MASVTSMKHVFNKVMLGCIHKFNYVVLSYQETVTPLVYHLFMLVEFLQMLFFIVNNVDLISEFSQIPKETISSNYTPDATFEQESDQFSNGTLRLENSEQVYGTDDSTNSINLASYILFANFQFYPLQAHSNRGFLTVYLILNIAFGILIAVIFCAAEKLYQLKLNNEVQGGINLFMIRIAGLITALFLFVLHIPMITINIQGYLCEEDIDDIYIIEDVVCDGMENQILIIVSTVMLIFFFTFLIIQSLLFTSIRFKEGQRLVPWASLSQEHALYRVIWKTFLVSSFMLDKFGRHRIKLNFITIALGIIVVYKYLNQSHSFNQGVKIMKFIYDSLITWLLLLVTLHLLTETQITIWNAALFFCSGLSISGFILLLDNVRSKKSIFEYFHKLSGKTSKTEKTINSNFSNLRVFIELLNLDDSFTSKLSKSTVAIMEGLLAQHIELCNDLDCFCLQDFDSLKISDPSPQIVNGPPTIQHKYEQDQFSELQSNHQLSDIGSFIGAASNEQNTSPPINDNLRNPQSVGLSFTLAGSIQRAKNRKRESSNQVLEIIDQGKNGRQINIADERQTNYIPELYEKYLKLLSLLLNNAILRSSKSSALKFLHFDIQTNSKHGALFQLMKLQCENLSFSQRYFYQTRMFETTHYLQQGQNYSDLNQLDITKVFNFEKQFQKLVKYQYLSAFAIRDFWNQLIQKESYFERSAFNQKADLIQDHCAVISEIYRDLANHNPNNISFKLQQAMLLKLVMNNDIESATLYEEAVQIYQRTYSQKRKQFELGGGGTALSQQEIVLFCENSGCSLFVLDINSNQCRIVHMNEEAGKLFGYQRSDLIGQSIDILVPMCINDYHQKEVKSLLQSAREGIIIDKTRDMFAITSNGNAFAIKLLIKMSSNLGQLIVFIQRNYQEQQQGEITEEYQKLQQHIIITNQYGDISNVSQGLKDEIGLDQQLFAETSQTKINITHLLETDQPITNQAQVVNLSTRFLQDRMLIDFSSSQDFQMTSKQQNFKAIVSCKEIAQGQAYVYTLIILPQSNIEVDEMSLPQSSQVIKQSAFLQIKQKSNQKLTQNYIQQNLSDVSEPDIISASISSSASSPGSSDSSSNRGNIIINELKTHFNYRTTPTKVNLFRKVLQLLLLMIIGLTITEYIVKEYEIKTHSQQALMQVEKKDRAVNVQLLTMNVRSLINIANGIEADKYRNVNLSRIDRFEYLQQLVAKQAEEAQASHNRIMKVVEYAQSDSIEVKMYRLASNGTVIQEVTKFNEALNNYLNDVNGIDHFQNQEQLIITPELLLASNYSKPLANAGLTETEKIIYFILANGQREIVQSSFDQDEHDQYEESSNRMFLSFMIIGLGLCAVKLIAIYAALNSIENFKSQVLKLFLQIDKEQLSTITQNCLNFIKNIENQEEVSLEQNTNGILFKPQEYYQTKFLQVKSIIYQIPIVQQHQVECQEEIKEQENDMIKQLDSTIKKKNRRKNKQKKIDGKQSNLKNAFDVKEVDDDDEIVDENVEKKQLQENVPPSKSENKRPIQTKQSLKSQLKKHLIILVTVIVAIGYFIFGYLYQISQQHINEELSFEAPVLIERYIDTNFAFSFMKERIINNHMSTQQLGFEFTNDLDFYYQSKSLDVEQEINQLKILAPHFLDTLLNEVNMIDSSKFCQKMFGVIKGHTEEKVTITKNIEAKLRKIRREAYQKEIDTTIAACNAAAERNLGRLQELYRKGVNLSHGDYDKRTPLHIACSDGYYDIVQFLVNSGVEINTKDRWGATPLNDADAYPEIKELLKSKGAIEGQRHPPFHTLPVTITQDQYRVYYAAYFGNVHMMDNLRLLGWNVNGHDYDGRTALGIAASEGHLDAVKYLIQKGADMNLKDARGNDPLDDAKRENRTAVIDYLINEALIRNLCVHYESELFNHGMVQVFSMFHKKFNDLSIRVNELSKNSSQSNNKPLSLKTLNQSEYRILEIFSQTSELYLGKVIQTLLDDMRITYKERYVQQELYMKIVFFCFIFYLLGALFVMLKKLINSIKEDISQSRWLIYLLPEQFLKSRETQIITLAKMMQ